MMDPMKVPMRNWLKELDKEALKASLLVVLAVVETRLSVKARAKMAVVRKPTR